MNNSFMLGITVVVLVAVFATLALPEITGSLATTQATATGITGPLSMALDTFPYVLIIGVIAILGSILIISMRKP